MQICTSYSKHASSIILNPPSPNWMASHNSVKFCRFHSPAGATALPHHRILPSVIAQGMSWSHFFWFNPFNISCVIFITWITLGSTDPTCFGRNTIQLHFTITNWSECPDNTGSYFLFYQPSLPQPFWSSTRTCHGGTGLEAERCRNIDNSSSRVRKANHLRYFNFHAPMVILSFLPQILISTSSCSPLWPDLLWASRG